ncbi:MAG TPA: serine hydrolase domain-containing protein [Saprospiraceae bacterium]|nr:serine hydrolase domain-containing protein [Saprospiraceae bacterium]HMQ84550.1 serine hydrolase domain-containing protein [Saprospiraceae bacterium]
MRHIHSMLFALFILVSCSVPKSKVLAQGNDLQNITYQTNNKQSLTNEEQVDELFKNWNNPNSTGLVVAIVKDGKIVYQQGYGMANLEYFIPNNPKSTVFEVASVSKQFTSFCILLLEKEGKLSLEDDIRKYIPEIPDFGYKITLKQLASHTSGIRDQWELLKLAGWRMDDVIDNEHIFKLIKRQKELNFIPGEKFSYSNTGHTLLAEVVSRVSGKTFSEFAKEQIFEPLGMKNTLFLDDFQMIVKNMAYSYNGDIDEGFKKSVLSISNVGPTNLFTTAEDMTKWALNFDQPIIGDATLISKLNEVPLLNNGEKSEYALGQFSSIYKGLKVFEHSGSEAAYESFFIRFPEQQFAVIILSNDGAIWAEGKAYKICDIYLDKEFIKTNTENNNAPESIENSKPIRIDTKTQQQYVGNYWNESEGLERAIKFENDTLRYVRQNNNFTNLLPIEKNKFVLQGLPSTIQIHFNKFDNKNYEMVFIDGEEKLSFVQMMDVALKDYAGRYYSEELDTYYTLSIEENQLIAHHQRNKNIQLNPITIDRFHSKTWFFKNITFERTNGLVSGFKISNRGVENLFFKKVNNE